MVNYQSISKTLYIFAQAHEVQFMLLFYKYIKGSIPAGREKKNLWTLHNAGVEIVT